jgi:CRISPR system Cascade subunit CasB
MSQTFAESFVQYLQNIESDRGKMATLRKGLVENQSQATWPLLSRFVNFDNPYQIKVIQTVAGLFAHHAKITDTGNIGSLCFQLLDGKEKQDIDEGESGPISRNFHYALAANNDEIFPRVRRLIFRAKTEEIPVNYVQLTKDLLEWNSYRKERIKLTWGREFWKIQVEKETAEQAEEVVSHD